MQRYRLARADALVPMPDRGPGVLFSADPAGESVNTLDPYYARMIADGDLVPVDIHETQPGKGKKGA